MYGAEFPERLFSDMLERVVERALVLDAACVVVNLLYLPEQPELYGQCIHNISTLRAACEPVGLPLMVEPLAMKPGAGGYGVDGDTVKIVPLVRQAAELGADIVKADPTDDLDDYPRVIEAAGGRPVLVRGGGRVSDEDILRRTDALMGLGATGIVYGRNVIQHERPAAMTRALMDVVHGASPPTKRSPRCVPAQIVRFGVIGAGSWAASSRVPQLGGATCSTGCPPEITAICDRIPTCSAGSRQLRPRIHFLVSDYRRPACGRRRGRDLRRRAA